jgi:hypothetical protein
MERQEFQPVKFRDWWKEPNEVKKNRMKKVSPGLGLRKDLWPLGTELSKEESRSKKQKRKCSFQGSKHDLTLTVH